MDPKENNIPASVEAITPMETNPISGYLYGIGKAIHEICKNDSRQHWMFTPDQLQKRSEFINRLHQKAMEAIRESQKNKQA